MNPELIKIEVTSRCNGFCVFCGHPGTGEDMDIGKFKWIVDMFPETKMFHTQFYGEPLLYQNIVEAIKYLKDKGKQVCFYTNGSFQSDEQLNEIAKLKPDKVVFSIDAIDSETYSKIRPGLYFDTIISFLKKFIAACNGTPIIVRATRCKENYGTDFEPYFKAMGVKFVSYPEAPVYRKAKIEYTHRECNRPFTQLIIKANGDVVGCCIDWHAKHVIGNIFEDHNIWGSEKFNEMRHAVKSNNFDLCKTCGFMMKDR